MNIANLLKTILTKGELHCIAATTLDKYQKYIEKDSAFEQYFQQVLIQELSTANCISVLRSLKNDYESKFGVRILDTALIEVAQLSHRYVTNRLLPAKATQDEDSGHHILRDPAGKMRKSHDLTYETCVNVQTVNRLKLINQLDVKAPLLSQEKEETLEQCVKQELNNISVELKASKLSNETTKERVDEFKKLKEKLEDFHNKLIKAEQEKKLDLFNDMKSRAISNLKEQNKQEKDRLLLEVVGKNDITEIVSQWVGISASEMLQTERDRLLKLSENLHKKVIGQDDAVDRVAEVVLRNRTNLLRQNQPIGSFLFLGPSGVGKTKLAKTLALELFNSSDSMICINMSEYIESHSITRLIGVPPGSVGFERCGLLIEAIRQRPDTVILFDEVEKGHPRIWDTLLQVLNDGRLPDEEGHAIDFTNSIIVLTSTIGAQYISEEIQNPSSTTKSFDRKLSQTIKDCVTEEVRLHFRPEFLDRLDGIVVFQPLDINHLSSIVHLQLQSLEKRFKEEYISVTLTDKAIQLALKKSYNPIHGVRPLKRYIEQHITTELSKLLIQMKIAPHSHIEIDIDKNDQYQVQVQQLQSATSNTSAKPTYNRRRTHEESYKEAIIVDDDAEECDNFEDDDNTKNPSRGISKRMKPS